MKKSLIAGVIFGLLFVSMIGFASAATLGESVGDILNGTAEVLTPVFQYTLGANGLDGETLFIKVLLFILMLTILYYAVSKVPILNENDYTKWIVAIVIAVLGARFLSSEALINAIWLPSGVLGVALTSLLPFIIYFFFIEENFQGQRVLRRTGWILFMVIFIVLAATRWDSFAVVKEAAKEGKSAVFGFNFAWIYIITAILAFLSFLLDKTINRWWAMAKLEGSSQTTKFIQINKYTEKKEELIKALSTAIAEGEKAKDIKAIEKQIENIDAALVKLRTG